MELSVFALPCMSFRARVAFGYDLRLPSPKFEPLVPDLIRGRCKISSQTISLTQSLLERFGTYAIIFLGSLTR